VNVTIADQEEKEEEETKFGKLILQHE